MPFVGSILFSFSNHSIPSFPVRMDLKDARIEELTRVTNELTGTINKNAEEYSKVERRANRAEQELEATREYEKKFLSAPPETFLHDANAIQRATNLGKTERHTGQPADDRGRFFQKLTWGKTCQKNRSASLCFEGGVLKIGQMFGSGPLFFIKISTVEPHWKIKFEHLKFS